MGSIAPKSKIGVPQNRSCWWVWSWVSLETGEKLERQAHASGCDGPWAREIAAPEKLVAQVGVVAVNAVALFLFGATRSARTHAAAWHPRCLRLDGRWGTLANRGTGLAAAESPTEAPTWSDGHRG